MWAGDKSPASLTTLPYSGFHNILHFQASEAQSIKVGGKVNQNSDVPKSPLQQQHPERVQSSTGLGWTRGSPPSFLSSKAGGRAFPVLTLPVPRPACLQGGALSPSHSVMQTASCHCLALFKGTAAGVLRVDYVEPLSVLPGQVFFTLVTSTIPASCLAVVWKTVL